MRLQLLGDARDAFKWDLLHFLMTEGHSWLSRLLYVPMPCDDLPDSTHGRTSPHLYGCNPEVGRFLEKLRSEPRSFERVSRMGVLDDARHYTVDVYMPERLLGWGWSRANYWRSLVDYKLSDALVFLDPDNGFETATQASPQHLRFGEVLAVLEASDTVGGVAVYQHRPQRQPWKQVLDRILRNVPPKIACTAVCASQAGLIIFGSTDSLSRVESIINRYVETHHDLKVRAQPALAAVAASIAAEA